MFRLFVAIQPPPEIARELEALCFGIPGARWTDPEQFHLTLRFVGEVDGAVFRTVAEALDSVHVPPFDLEVAGLGFFPPRRDPEVLWVGVDPSEELERLRSKIERAVHVAGIAPEGRKFHPHFTLARLKGTPAPRVAAWLAHASPVRLPPFSVREFHLFSSRLGSEGAQHQVEASYPLE